jgi:hypothetical protein
MVMDLAIKASSFVVAKSRDSEVVIFGRSWQPSIPDIQIGRSFWDILPKLSYPKQNNALMAFLQPEEARKDRRSHRLVRVLAVLRVLR